jgi:hypothetical protein
LLQYHFSDKSVWPLNEAHETLYRTACGGMEIIDIDIWGDFLELTDQFIVLTKKNVRLVLGLIQSLNEI